MKRRIIVLIACLVMGFVTFAQAIPTKEEFIKVCDSLEIHHPYVVYAQACLESGNFTSAHFRNRNNCFGLYDSKNKRYASFSSWQECLSKYKTWFQYRCKNTNMSDLEYLQWVVNHGYASDKTYYGKVLKIYNKVKE